MQFLWLHLCWKAENGMSSLGLIKHIDYAATQGDGQIVP